MSGLAIALAKFASTLAGKIIIVVWGLTMFALIGYRVVTLAANPISVGIDEESGQLAIELDTDKTIVEEVQSDPIVLGILELDETVKEVRETQEDRNQYIVCYWQDPPLECIKITPPHMAILNNEIPEDITLEDSDLIYYLLLAGDYQTLPEYEESVATDEDGDGIGDTLGVEGVDYLVLKPQMECIVWELRAYPNIEVGPYVALVFDEDGLVVNNDDLPRGLEWAFVTCEGTAGLIRADHLVHYDGRATWDVVKEMP